LTSILIVKLGSIGDIVHTLPSLAAIRRAMPDAQISWVAESRSAEILHGNPLIDNLIEVDTRSLRGGKVVEEMLLGATRQLRELRRFSFDAAIDFQGLWKSAMIAKFSGAKTRFGFSREGLREPASRVLLTDQVRAATGIHVVRKNLALAAGALGISVPDAGFEFPIATASEHEAEAAAIVESIGSGRFAVLNPAGGWVTKLWPAERFGELADQLWAELRLASVVVTGPRETELAQNAAASSSSGALTLAEPSLKGFYELAKRAAIYVGGDTGPTHIALAAGAPIVGLFGPTEWWRNGSTNRLDICVERADIGCRANCHKRTCPEWVCMDLDVNRVMSAVVARLAEEAALSAR
jgi:lipopolysaccharide heptosyltransferase I